MAKGIYLNSEKLFNGSFGELLDFNGNFVAQCQGIRYKILNKSKSLNLVGSGREANKHIGTVGTGSIDLFKVNSDFLTRVAAPMWDQSQRPQIGNLVVYIDDPEAITFETVILTGVKLLDLEGGWAVNQVIMESINFTFHSILVPHQIPLTDTNLFSSSFEERWHQQRNL